MDMANIVPYIDPDTQAVMQKRDSALKDVGREVAQLAEDDSDNWRDQTAWSKYLSLLSVLNMTLPR